MLIQWELSSHYLQYEITKLLDYTGTYSSIILMLQQLAQATKCGFQQNGLKKIN